MFGKILTITKNNATVKLTQPGNILSDLINIHVVFEDTNKKILGEVEEINIDTINVKFLGEITSDFFIPGVIKKPTLDASVRVISENELKMLIGSDEKSITIGVSPLYNNYPLKVQIDELFSNHTAIFGTSGSGKTNGICRIIQNIFSNSTVIPYKATLFIFDSFGEYINAFKEINNVNPYFSFKVITSSIKPNDYQVLNIPVHLLEKDDILNLLDAHEFSQISMIENALNLVKIFIKDDRNSKDYQNHILAKAIMNILFSNQTASRIRDQIFEILAEQNTPELGLNIQVPGIGYLRSFKDCFVIDSEGSFVESKLIIEYLSRFIKDDKEWFFDETPVSYSLKDLETALNFTLYGEKYLLNEKLYNEAISLKVKLHELANGIYSRFFTNGNYINLEQYINYLQLINDRKAQIININLEDVDDRFAKTITKIFARLFNKYVRELENRASKPIHMIIEEAHRFVTECDDKKLLGYNIFERIAKEGRKYGLILNLITQRPTDINEDVISQCANFIIFRINHPLDLEYISKMIPNMSSDIVEKQKNLQVGTCVAFGKLFKIPMIVKMEKANPEPESSNCEIFDSWMVSLTQRSNVTEGEKYG